MSCVVEVMEAFPDLSRRQAERLNKVFDKIIKENETDLTRIQELSRTAVDRAELEALERTVAKVDANIKRKANLEHLSQEGFKGDIVEGLLSIVEGTTRKVSNKFNTVENTFNTFKASLIRGFNNDLDHKNIRKILASGKFDEKIIVEMFNRVDEGYISKMPDEVIKAADAIERLNKRIIKLQRDNGSTIKYREGYLFQQTHNPDEILSDVDTWISDTLELIDVEKSFGGLQSPKQAAKTLREMADNLGDIGLGSKSFMGGTREIVFRDGESFFKYNQKYGFNNLYEGLIGTITEGARKASLNAKFGNNPMSQAKELLENVSKVHNISQDHKKVGKFMDSIQGFSGSSQRYDDFDSIYGKSFRAIQAKKKVDILRLLGQTGFTSLMDLSTTMMTLRTADGSTISNFAKVPIEWLKSVTPVGKSRKEMAELLLISIEDTAREIAELGPSTYNMGSVSSIMDTWMTINLTKPVTNINRSTAMRLHAKSLTDNIETPLGNLNDFQKGVREATGLTDKELSDLSLWKKQSGEEYVSPGMLEEFRTEANSKYIDGLQTKLGNYFNEQIRKASPVRGLKEERQLGLTRSKDDPIRLAAELGTQFKGTVLKSGHVFAEMLRASDSKGSLISTEWNSLVSLAQGVFAATLVGTTVNSLKDFIRGRETEITPSWIAKSMIDSGAAGMYVDLVLEVFTRDGMSRGVSPIIQSADDVVRFINNEIGIAEGRRAERNSFLERSWKLMARQTLPQNLWLIEFLNAHIMKEAITLHKGEL